MWEELLKMLSASGGAETAISSGALGNMAGELAMKADPNGVLQVLGPQTMPQGSPAVPGMSWDLLVNPVSPVQPNAAGGVSIPGTGAAGADMMLTPLPQQAPPIPQVPNAPSWDMIIPPGRIPAAAQAAAATPPVTSTRPSVGLTPEQAMALMKGQQQHDPRMPNAPAINGQPTRQVQFSQLQANPANARPSSLGDLIYRRR